MANERVISVILEDGTLNGIVQVYFKNQSDALIMSSPRSSIDRLFDYEPSKHFGVYLLISDKRVYIGQASELKSRIKTHQKNMDWWNQAILLTKKENSFNHSDIDYIESKLIDKARTAGVVDIKNKQSGNKYNLQREDIIILDEYIDNVLFLLEFIGVKVFLPRIDSSKTKIQLVSHEVLQLVQRTYAIKYLKDNGIITSEDYSYSKRDDRYNKYAIDCPDSLIRKDWTIILNNQINWCFYVIKIPKNTIKESDLKGFKKRKDNNSKLCLRINGDTFIDKHSGFDFTEYKVQTIPYGDK